jgi:hypothetical protein
MGHETMPALSGEVYFRYDIHGSEKPPSSTKLIILTVGDVAIISDWQWGLKHVAWSPLPKKKKPDQPTGVQNGTS